MIVLIAADHIKDHAAKLLFAITHGKAQAPDHIECLLVGIGTRRVEIEVGERSKGLHVQLAAIAATVKPARHEVAPATLLQQPAFGHLDTGVGSHQRIRVLDDRISFGVLEFLVLVGADAVELQQPVIESGRGLHLAGPHLIGLPVPGDDGLRPRAAGGRAHPQHLLQPFMPPTRGK